METHPPFIKASSHTVPLDILMDILRILLHHDINWQVEGMNETENSLLIQVRIPSGSIRHQKALANMEHILRDYGYYLKGSPASESGGAI